MVLSVYGITCVQRIILVLTCLVYVSYSNYSGVINNEEQHNLGGESCASTTEGSVVEDSFGSEELGIVKADYDQAVAFLNEEGVFCGIFDGMESVN